MSHVDVAVVGAGPAGLAAAARIAETVRASVTVLDEGPVAGGRLRAQLYRRGSSWFVGAEHARALSERADRLGVSLRMGTQVWSIESLENPEGTPRFSLGLTGGDTLTADHLVIATGAAERTLGLPGWTLPGVLAVGAVQSMLNIHRVVPGDRIAVIGVDPLSLSIVDELAAAGHGVTGIYLPPPPPDTAERGSSASGEISGNAPSAVLRRLSHLRGLAPSGLLGAAMGALAIPGVSALVARLWPRRGMTVSGMPLHLRECVTSIDGESEVTGIRVAQVDADGRPVGRERAVAVDTVCLSGGLYPLQDLTTGCALVDVAELGGRVPLHGPNMQTNIDGLYVAGNVTGVESAEVARAQGALAGAAISAAIDGHDDSAALSSARAEVETARAAAPLTFEPTIARGRRRMAELWRDSRLFGVRS